MKDLDELFGVPGNWSLLPSLPSQLLPGRVPTGREAVSMGQTKPRSNGFSIRSPGSTTPHTALSGWDV